MKNPPVILAVCISMALSVAWGGEKDVTLIVAKDGSGNFTTIQRAIDSAGTASSMPAIILVRNGTYDEQVFIRRSHVTLIGEDWDSVRIVSAVLRKEWNGAHGGSDWGAGVVNIDTGTTDVTLANLTVYNNHGSLHGTYKEHQFAIRGAGTRVMLLHCRVISDGGDALSLWDRNDGMYYHSDCYFEGWVDYVCPRGWCYIANSQFFGHNTPSASLWHDGSGDRSQKFVIKNSTIDGVPGFPLGRNHRDGQFYLINCRFSLRMADRPFYRPPSSPQVWQWGDRHYFYNCHRDGGDFAWFSDNLDRAEGAPSAKSITARWTFDGRWDPESSMPSVLPFAFLPTPARGDTVAATDLVLRWIPGRDASSHRIHFGNTNPPPAVTDQTGTSYEPPAVRAGTTYFWSIDEVTDHGVLPGQIWSFTTK